MCFIWSEFVIIYYYYDKLHVTPIFNTTNLSLKVLYFSGRVYKHVKYLLTAAAAVTTAAAIAAANTVCANIYSTGTIWYRY